MRAELLALLTERSFARREVTLASGRRSNFYVDCKQTTLSGRGHVLVGGALVSALSAWEARAGVQIAAAGGLTLGADPIASAVSMSASLAGRELPAFIVRKEAKGHGTKAYLEGTSNFAAGAELAILEDVVTTGGSALTAAKRVREAGYSARVVFGLVDRLEGGREAIEAAGLELVTLFDRTDFGVAPGE